MCVGAHHRMKMTSVVSGGPSSVVGGHFQRRAPSCYRRRAAPYRHVVYRSQHDYPLYGSSSITCTLLYAVAHLASTPIA
jgi:hypothetical protein